MKVISFQEKKSEIMIKRIPKKFYTIEITGKEALALKIAIKDELHIIDQQKREKVSKDKGIKYQDVRVEDTEYITDYADHIQVYNNILKELELILDFFDYERDEDSLYILSIHIYEIEYLIYVMEARRNIADDNGEYELYETLFNIQKKCMPALNTHSRDIDKFSHYEAEKKAEVLKHVKHIRVSIL